MTRLVYYDIICKVIYSCQPTQLSGIIYNKKLIGKHPNYVCIFTRGKRVVHSIALLCRDFQAISLESEVYCTMEKYIESLINSEMGDIFSNTNDLLQDFKKLDKDVDDVCLLKDGLRLVALVKGLVRHKITHLLHVFNIAELVQTNAFVCV